MLGVIFAAALDDPDTGFAADRGRGPAGGRRQRRATGTGATESGPGAGRLPAYPAVSALRRVVRVGGR